MLETGAICFTWRQESDTEETMVALPLPQVDTAFGER